MELKLGKMTSRELAEWFGISYRSYTHKISKYLDELDLFCDFEKVHGGVIIKEIFDPIYSKNVNKKDQELFLKEINRCLKEQDGLSTVAGMARLYTYDEPHYNNERTARRRLSKTSNRLFGKAATHQSGSLGHKEYVWAIKMSDYNEYRYMTEEEDKIFDEILTAFYTIPPEKARQLGILEDNLRNKEIDIDEYFKQKDMLELNLFSQCLKMFMEQTGYVIAKVSRHEIETSAPWEEDKNKEILDKPYEF